MLAEAHEACVRSWKKLLSILYLRCAVYVETDSDAAVNTSFNSLFEMLGCHLPPSRLFIALFFQFSI